MRFAGLQKSDLVNFPSLISCVLWLGGCNLACPYCHNPELSDSKALENCKNVVSEDEFFSFAQKRKAFLEGVVISGGEPTIHSELPSFLFRIRERTGLKIKLDTNLTNPDMLALVLSRGLVDYVAGDYKVPLSKYSALLVDESSYHSISEAVEKSIRALCSGKTEFELRTTCVKGLLSDEDFLIMKSELLSIASDCACKIRIKWFLQEFKNAVTLSPEYRYAVGYDRSELERIASALTDEKIKVFVR